MAAIEIQPKITPDPKTNLVDQSENVPKPTQAEIDAEFLAIAKRRMERHSKTWMELAKY